MTVDNILCILSGNQLMTLRDKSKKILQASYSNLSVILGSFVSHLYDHRWIKAHELVFCVSLLPHPFFVLFFPCTGLQHQGIFRVPGSQLEVNDIKNSFERGTGVLFSL